MTDIDFVSAGMNDAFLSYATEDLAFVKQLADTLERQGIKTWFAPYAIKVGESIRGKINEGLSSSRFGIVVLSPHFFAKKWPPKELAALAAILEEDRVLPVLLNLTVEELAEKDALLADTQATFANKGHAEVAAELARRIHPQGVLEADGRRHFRHEALRFVDIVRDADGVLRNVTFDNCLLQGPAVLMPRNPTVRIVRMGWNTPAVFWPIQRGWPYVGALGLDEVTFVECRFKDVGLCTTDYENTIRQMRDNPDPAPWSGILA